MPGSSRLRTIGEGLGLVIKVPRNEARTTAYYLGPLYSRSNKDVNSCIRRDVSKNLQPLNVKIYLTLGEYIVSSRNQ